MLTVTRKSDYALVALLHLVRHGDRVSSAREIADQNQVPSAILMNILKTLSQNSMITSVRGPRGGYRMTRAPQDISLLTIISAVEGPVNLFQCSRQDLPDECERDGQGCEREDWCPVSPSAREVSRRLRAFLESVTLADILNTRPAKKRTRNIQA
jgi:Rrf2 family protein